MILYDAVITTMNTRLDLLDHTVRAMMRYVDHPPARVIIHEDHKDGDPYDGGREFDQTMAGFRTDFPNITWVGLKSSYNRGLGPSILECLKRTSAKYVFYNQEDFEIVRPIPISKCAEIMSNHRINHVRFNKRDTLSILHEDVPEKAWKKIEVRMDNQTFCISDKWYFQCGLWNHALMYRAATYVCNNDNPKHWFEHKVGRFCDSNTGGRESIKDQLERHRFCRTYIYGKIDEKRFCKHIGTFRRTLEQELSRESNDPNEPGGTCNRFFRERSAPSWELLSVKAFDELSRNGLFKEGPFRNGKNEKKQQAFGWLTDGRFVYCLIKEKTSV